METKMLDKKYHIDENTGCLCRYVRSNTEYFRPHYHNYYEIFMVLKGNVCHTINSKEQQLCEGQILFIRDFDVHDYKSGDGNYFEFINLAFEKETFEDMAEYLGEGFCAENFLNCPFPPEAILSSREKEKLFFEFAELYQSGDKNYIKLKARALVLNIFTKYFSGFSGKTDSNIPSWLELTYELIKKPKNFVRGIDRLYALSGKSREHLSRCLKTYYNTTPASLITELRLNYASNLLISSNLSVTDICFECGFENLSWFYKVFCDKFGTTPAKYRKTSGYRQ